MKPSSTASTKHHLPRNKQKHITQYIKNICTVTATQKFIISSYEGNFASSKNVQTQFPWRHEWNTGTDYFYFFLTTYMTHEYSNTICLEEQHCQ
jgi:membrane-bound acyltransferase YfiQ involved in biofilm formation